MPKPGTITKSEAIRQVAAQIDGPISTDEFAEQVLAIWPTRAKNPKNSILTSLKYEHLGKNLLYLDANTLVPMRLAMRGVRFRVSLSRQEVDRGWLFAYPAFQFLHKGDLPADQVLFEDVHGRSIPANHITVKFKKKSFFGVQDNERTVFDLGRWYKKHNVRRKDSLLITVLDWETGRFQLQPEPAREYKKHKREIEAQNQKLADHLFTVLESAKDESVWGRIIIPTAYLRLRDPEAYTADHWFEILENDPRMVWHGYEIRYGDWESPLASFLLDETRGPRVKPKSLSEQQAGQVYSFKAYFKHRKGLWRRIEIQGRQTLKEFDDILRDAFDHDSFDHLSGFWKLIRRGDTRRFREVDLGTINPFEGGDAADIRIADLELGPGEALKYVYDFGDWIEHRVELESVADPEPDVEYPLIRAQNKPRYKYCEVCKEEGRKSVAIWICITCSNRDERGVLLCEDHMYAHDEEHYTDELIY